MPGNGLNPAALRRMMDGYNAAPQAELLGLFREFISFQLKRG